MEIPALEINQWISPDWDRTEFNADIRKEPEHKFYLFSIKATLLKKLTGVYRRDPKSRPYEDHGIQRKHRPERSKEILRYLQFGFPLSRIDPNKLVDPSEKFSLQMPGWLPTAVVVNILTPLDRRGLGQHRVRAEDLVSIQINNGNSPIIKVPDTVKHDWNPTVHPIEVIDGQHRLWALEDPEDSQGTLFSQNFRNQLSEIEIPVVAFYGLDITWQAYLFYTINQLAKKIDTSMVFDLYPLLRTQEWLLRFEGTNIYRETRAQDLTILLWSHAKSPWRERIIRLGGREKGKVTQAAFLRSLMASFIKRWRTSPGRLGGLFGSPLGSHHTTLDWGREQQAAFLIAAWENLKDNIEASTAPWIDTILASDNNKTLLFSGPDTLIATDQGVRGFMCVLNDLLVANFNIDNSDLAKWDWEPTDVQSDDEAVSDALASFKENCRATMTLVNQITTSLASFDWRMSSVLNPNDNKYAVQASYRGSSGYKEIRRQMLNHIKQSNVAMASLVDKVLGDLDIEADEEN